MYEVRKILQTAAKDYELDCPQRIREHAMADACDAVKQAKIKCKKGKGYQQVAFRSRKEPRQGFGFDKASFNPTYIFSMNKFRVNFKMSELGTPMAEGTRIVTESGKWFVITPIRVAIKKSENQRFKMVAIDPGIRTFASYYSPEMHGQIGRDDFQRIYRLCYHLDQLQARMAKVGCKQRRRFRKAAARTRFKIRNLIDDLHHKFAHFLVTRFNIIVWTNFKPSQVVGKLRSKTSRALLTWAHYRFLEFLKCKAKEYSSEVVCQDEAYTSKTCSYCGKIHNIGSKRIMTCSCGAETDRDYNGARGIYLRRALVA